MIVAAPGTVIAGRYTVEAVLGRGGMGTVLRARDHDGAVVAVKVPARATDPEVAARLVREGGILARLASPHACRVLDVGIEAGMPFVVMELLDGVDLGKVLAARGKLEVAAAAAIVVDACAALAEAHAHGVVHRDVKPENLFLVRRAGREPLVKVLDFGASKVRGEGSAITGTSAVLGTPAYLAPEQIGGARDVDLRADVWALGVVLYRALTGVLPFDGPTLFDIAVRVAAEPPRPLRDHAPVPPAVEAAVLACLAKRPDARPTTEALVAMLRRAVPPSLASIVIPAQ